MMTFDEAFALLLDPVREGGYSDGRGDPGGETNFGITIATARRNGYAGDMRKLPLDLARAIYLREYWGPAGCEHVPDMVRFDLFDFAVNGGPTQAKRLLQRAVGAIEDGSIGPATLAAIDALPDWRVVARFAARVQEFRASLNNWPNAGRGWTRRNSANMLRW